MPTAWGDESGSVADLDPGAFIFGAVIVLAEHVDSLRAAMRALQLTSEKKIHWHDDSAKRHLEVMESIAELPLEGLVVVRVGPTTDVPERRRRKCFEGFVPALQALDCTHLTLESRGAHLDRKDRDMLAALRSRKVVTSELRLDHVPGPVEPILWIADAVCGAYVGQRTRGEMYFEEIRRLTHVIEVQT